MYTVRATLLRDGKPVDEEVVPFGIREFHFDADQGFFLNGVHHKVLGVALHTDGGAVGTAVPLAVWERRLTELRKLGVNAIRTAHNPPAPEFLDLADRMGFLIMDEMFDCWTVAKNPYDYHLYFKDWSIRDTTDTVMRDRNHPSIILWSAGNEIHDTPRPEVAIPILKSLVATFHQNDPTRPVTQALFRPNASHDYEDGLADLLDVVGQNYRPLEILKAHADKPTRSIIGTENAHDRDQWTAVRDHAEYSGQFLWSGIDYLGESRTWPTIGSGSGLLNYVALPHGRAFERAELVGHHADGGHGAAHGRRAPGFHRSRLRQRHQHGPVRGFRGSPSCSYTAPSRRSPSRCWRASGGRSLGALLRAAAGRLDPEGPDAAHGERRGLHQRRRGRALPERQVAGHAEAAPRRQRDHVYQVPFEPGTLKAVARSGSTIVATDELKTAGKPARIVFTADKPATPLTPDWNDVRYVTATLVDEAGTRIPDSTTVVHFAATGPASIIAVDNGNLTDHDPYQATQRKLYFGNALALLRATGSSGKVTVTASADGVPAASLTLTAAPIDKEDPAIAKTAANERGF